jgi:excisionase family DNA binding protein
MNRRYLSVNETAGYIGLSACTVRRLIDKEELPAVRIGRNVRIDLKKLEAQLEAQLEGKQK